MTLLRSRMPSARGMLPPGATSSIEPMDTIGAVLGSLQQQAVKIASISLKAVPLNSAQSPVHHLYDPRVRVNDVCLHTQWCNDDKQQEPLCLYAEGLSTNS